MEIKGDMDLSGKLIIKVQLGDDIRRIPIHNEAITYDELLLMMQRVFQGKLVANDDITIKYKDDDGDLVTIFDNSDLSYATQCSRILKLQILENNKLLKDEERRDSAKINDVAEIKSQLRKIRDQVNSLLDVLDTENGNKPNSSPNDDRAESEQVTNGSHFQASNVALNKVNSSEFDPLQGAHGLNPAEPSKKEAANPNVVGSIDSSEVVSENRSQSVPVNPAITPNTSTAAPSANAHYGRPPTTGYSYRSLPYPQQYAAYTQANFGQQVEQSEPNMYMSGMYSQPGQPTGQPFVPSTMGYRGAPPLQNNPYSKTFSQQQHFMPR